MILGTSFSARTATCDFSKKKKNNPVSMFTIFIRFKIWVCQDRYLSFHR